MAQAQYSVASSELSGLSELVGRPVPSRIYKRGECPAIIHACYLNCGRVAMHTAPDRLIGYIMKGYTRTGSSGPDQAA